MWLLLLYWFSAELSAEEIHRVAPHIAADFGHRKLLNVAGEGAPLIGTVVARDSKLFLRTTGGHEWQLAGPLAIPRIAGPQYRVWALGTVSSGSLRARRLGVLSPPQ